MSAVLLSLQLLVRSDICCVGQKSSTKNQRPRQNYFPNLHIAVKAVAMNNYGSSDDYFRIGPGKIGHFLILENEKSRLE